MSLTEARVKLQLALIRMQTTSDALASNYSADTLTAYCAANADAQAAHHALLLAAIERSKTASGGA